MNIPLVDLQTQYEAIRADIDAAIANVIRDTAFVGGKYVKSFEESFAEYCGTSYAVGVSNGTDAIRLALLACGIGAGDEVITVPNTFIATFEAIDATGATVRFVDVDPDTFNMDPSLLAAAITPRTRAIVPVHLYGQPADMNPILRIAREHGLRVIGDAAQAHAARYHNSPIGTIGDAVTFSFYPGKNLGAYGDAGAIVTNDKEIAEKAAKLRDHGRTTKYEHDTIGFNCRLDGLQAAILSAKLPYLDEWTAARRRNAGLYNSLLADVGSIQTPTEMEEVFAVYHLYVIQTDERERLQSCLKESGISTGIHYPIPLHLQPALAHLNLARGNFPVTESHADRILSLPMYPELSAEHIERAAATIKNALAASYV